MEHLERIAVYIGSEFTKDQLDLLSRYNDWLVSEAIPAGGMGPSEADRVETRHIGDSLLFGHFLENPVDVWDLGSGVGLPGIPLAIAYPGSAFSLIDRSGRRCELMRRALRILDLPNVEVKHADIDALTGTTDAIVSRGTLPPPSMLNTAKRLLVPEGLAVVGGSWKKRPIEEGWETKEVPTDVLDRPIWILMMRNE